MRFSTAAFTTTLVAIFFSAAHAQIFSGNVGYYTDTTTYAAYANKLPISDKYTVEIKKDDNTWVSALTLISRAAENGTKMAPAFPNHVPDDLNTENNYYDNLLGWTHSYTNLVYKRNASIQVRITKNFNSSFAISAASTKIYPADKVSNVHVTGGKLYFTLKPNGQVAIDINGAYGSSKLTTYMPSNTQKPNNDKYHMLSVHSNPQIKRPKSGLTVPAGSLKYVYDQFDGVTKNTMIFGPGVHNVGLDFKLKHGATYYIPGNAIVYGTFNNILTGSTGVADKFDDNINKVTISGHGTISGAKIMHWDVAHDENGSTLLTDAGKKAREKRSERKIGINIINCDEVYTNGITIADPANHATKYIYYDGYKANDTGTGGSVQSTKFVKVFGWRLNSDGGGCAMNSRIKNIFYRVQDDMLYPHGKSINDCVFWTDSNGTIRLDAIYDVKAQNKQITYKGFDIIFNRTLFDDQATISAKQMDFGKDYTELNVVFDDIDVSDPNPTTMLFNLAPNQHISGLTFINLKAKNFVKKSELTPTTLGFLSKVTFSRLENESIKVTDRNYSDYFNLNNVNIHTHSIKFLDQVLADGIYTLRNQVPSSLYVAAPALATENLLRSVRSLAGNDTLWTFTHVSNNFYTITSRKSEHAFKSIEVPYDDFTGNVKLGLWATDPQTPGNSWLLERMSNGNFKLRPKGAETTKAMDGGTSERLYPTSSDIVVDSNQEFTIAQ